MHFQWVSDDHWSQHVQIGRGLMLELRHTYMYEQDTEMQCAHIFAK